MFGIVTIFFKSYRNKVKIKILKFKIGKMSLNESFWQSFCIVALHSIGQTIPIPNISLYQKPLTNMFLVRSILISPRFPSLPQPILLKPQRETVFWSQLFSFQCATSRWTHALWWRSPASGTGRSSRRPWRGLRSAGTDCCRTPDNELRSSSTD